MLRSARGIIGWTASARGGPAGVARDLLVDDRQWAVRHLTVETTSLAHVRHALVSPKAVRRLNDERRRVELSLELWEVSAAPDIEYDPPIAVQQEQLHYDTLGWRYYLRPPEAAEATTTAARQGALAPRTRARQSNDPHLRSVEVMTGYRVEGKDGGIGSLRDFVLDDETWQIGCVVVEGPTGGVAVSVTRVRAIDWVRSEMGLDLTQEQVAAMAPYDSGDARCQDSAA